MTVLLLVGGGRLPGVDRPATPFPKPCNAGWARRPSPYGTFAVNMIGCLLIGLLLGIIEQRGGGSNLRTFAAIGVLGGFTTFSAFGYDHARPLPRRARPGGARQRRAPADAGAGRGLGGLERGEAGLGGEPSLSLSQGRPLRNWVLKRGWRASISVGGCERPLISIFSHWEKRQDLPVPPMLARGAVVQRSPLGEEARPPTPPIAEVSRGERVGGGGRSRVVPYNAGARTPPRPSGYDHDAIA